MPLNAEDDDVINDVISLHASKTHCQVYFRGFMALDLEIWLEGGNCSDYLKSSVANILNTETENKVTINNI